MKRVLFVAAMGGLGGPVRRLATLLGHLDGDAIEKVLIKPRSQLLDAGIAREHAVDEHIVLKRSAQRDHLGAALLALAVLRRCLNRRRPIDVIHANGLVEFALSWPAALLLHKPVVTWVGNYEAPAFVKRFHPVFRSVAKRTTWNAVSSYAAEVIEDCGLADRGHVNVVTNIVDPEDVAFPHTAPKQGRFDDRVTVGYLQVARWEKGFDLLAPTIMHLADLDGRVGFYVYASPSEQDGWAELNKCPPSMIDLRPRTGNVGEIYEACDIIFSPSRRESFNRVVAEALTTGRAVVASDLPPVREVIGDAGLLFPVEDVKAAAAHLRRLITDPALRAELADRGRRRSQSWQPGPVAAEFQRQYERA